MRAWAWDGLSAFRRVFAMHPYPAADAAVPDIVVILSGIFAVQNFVPILLLTNGGPGTATMVPGLDMYQSAFQNDQYGYGMAIGTLLFAAMLIFTLAVMPACVPGRTDRNSTQEVGFHVLRKDSRVVGRVWRCWPRAAWPRDARATRPARRPGQQRPGHDQGGAAAEHRPDHGRPTTPA